VVRTGVGGVNHVVPSLFPFTRSWVGYALAGVYVALAVGVIQWEIRHTGGGWINLRDLGTKLVTVPSQVVFSPIFKAMGVPPINVDRAGVSDIAQLGFHVLVTATLCYALGWAIHTAVRRLFA
jgi:hypothetical protein